MIRATALMPNLVGITQISTEVPDVYSLSQNYPNPFNPVTKIKFDVPKNSNAALFVFNSLGEVVKSENFGSLAAGEYEYSLNGNNISSGVYFYKLILGDYTDTKKMILVK